MADCIACGAAIPNPLRAASSQHHGRRRQRSVLSESMVGASNWEGSADVTKKRFYYTRQSTGLWLIASSSALPPLIRFMPVHPNTMGNPPPCLVLSELIVVARIRGGYAQQPTGVIF
jgi:hypothetical protein